ncbi:uncharacterized protein LOC134291223 [Aedes albopictus]|uniref:Uncharacterized protein n=1 Tax=Aedes albopictus TaxID=7160 RepID=A0ABM1YY73_AEDAL
MLMDHYFSPQSVYPENLFKRRFRMPKRMFLRILEDITADNDYFKLKCNAAGKPGLSGIQKRAAAIRQLAYGTASDATDEYIQIGESTANEAMKEFCRTLLKLYREIFFASTERKPEGCIRRRKREPAVPWNDWQYRLHALGVEELPSCPKRPIPGQRRQSNGCTRGSGEL